MKAKTLVFVITLVSILACGREIQAAPLLCRDITLNHMFVDSSVVSACLLSGVGNLTGNPANDLFLTNPGGTDYDYIGAGGFTQSGLTGTFSLSPSDIWDHFDDIAIGFKFGTGNEPDEWFVYQANDGVLSGDWQFVDVFGKGGGLSHVNIYGSDYVGETTLETTPEPGTLILMGTGISILIIRSRFRSKKLPQN